MKIFRLTLLFGLCLSFSLIPRATTAPTETAQAVTTTTTTTTMSPINEDRMRQEFEAGNCCFFYDHFNPCREGLKCVNHNDNNDGWGCRCKPIQHIEENPTTTPEL